LSFEFDVPQAVEDAVAGHITTTGAPWDQPRYENPAADVTDPNHRAALAERYDAIGDPAPVNTVVTRVTEAITTDDAPEGEGLTTEDATVESVALLESDPEAVPTFDGVAVLRDVPAGDHRLTVNGAGQAPHSERVSVSDDGGDGRRDRNGGPVTAAGVDGGSCSSPTVTPRNSRSRPRTPTWTSLPWPSKTTSRVDCTSRRSRTTAKTTPSTFTPGARTRRRSGTATTRSAPTG